MNTKFEALNSEIERLETARAKFAAFREPIQERITALKPKLRDVMWGGYDEFVRLKDICNLIDGEEICEFDGVSTELYTFLHSPEIQALNLAYSRPQDAGLGKPGHTNPRHPGLAQIDRELMELRAKRDAAIAPVQPEPLRRYRYIGRPRVHLWKGQYLVPGDIVELTERYAEPFVKSDVTSRRAYGASSGIPVRFEPVTESAEVAATNSVEATV